MEHADVMPGRLEAFLADAEADATDISVTNFEPMTGGYSRVMARFDLKWRRAGLDETRSLVWRADPPPDPQPDTPMAAPSRTAPSATLTIVLSRNVRNSSVHNAARATPRLPRRTESRR